jgi:hypothetical protein
LPKYQKSTEKQQSGVATPSCASAASSKHAESKRPASNDENDQNKINVSQTLGAKRGSTGLVVSARSANKQSAVQIESTKPPIQHRSIKGGLVSQQQSYKPVKHQEQKQEIKQNLFCPPHERHLTRQSGVFSSFDGKQRQQQIKKVPLSAKHLQAPSDQRAQNSSKTSTAFNFPGSLSSHHTSETNPGVVQAQQLPKSTRNLASMQGRGLHAHNDS